MNMDCWLVERPKTRSSEKFVAGSEARSELSPRLVQRGSIRLAGQSACV